MKLVSRLLMLSCFLFSCQKQGPNFKKLEDCDLAEPITELAWLATKIDAYSSSACLETLHQYRFREGTVFVLRCGIESFCNCLAPAVWGCEGQELFTLSKAEGGMSEAAFLAEASDEKLLWKNE